MALSLDIDHAVDLETLSAAMSDGRTVRCEGAQKTFVLSGGNLVAMPPIPFVCMMFYGGLSLPYLGEKASIRALTIYQELQPHASDSLRDMLHTIYLQLGEKNAYDTWPKESLRLEKIHAWSSCILLLMDRGELPNDEMNGVCPFENVPYDLVRSL